MVQMRLKYGRFKELAMKLFLAATCAALMIGSAASAATIVQNGSFEDVGGQSFSNGNWGIFSTLPGWTSGPNGIEVQTNATLGTINAQQGNQYVELDSRANSFMEQALSTAIGTVYRLTFWYSPRENNPLSDGISYAIAGLSGTVNAPLGYNVDGWRKVSATFVATSATSTLRFDAVTASNSFGGLIDSVSVAAVPVPAAGFMLFGALGGLFALRRRKAAVAV
jgi:opacity protein-like surface antigen